MRNNPIQFPVNSTRIALVLGLVALPWLTGCMDNPSRGVLNRAYNGMFAEHHGDGDPSARYDQADADADEFLRAHPNTIGTAEAYYLKGRIQEARAQDPEISPKLSDKLNHLDQAKEAYETGLRKGAPIGIRAQLHTGVANVLWYEEDYAGALQEWQASYENLAKDEYKAWVLYQIGRAQQRLGMFTEADASFRDVQKYYPAVAGAVARSAARIGMNAFYVEVVEYPDVPRAEQTAAKLRKDGLSASRKLDAGRQVVHVGPMQTYAAAKAMQTKLLKEFPTAVISP